MELGICSVSLLDRSWEAALDTLADHGIRWIEADAGGHIPKDHFDPHELVADESARRRFDLAKVGGVRYGRLYRRVLEGGRRADGSNGTGGIFKDDARKTQ